MTELTPAQQARVARVLSAHYAAQPGQDTPLFSVLDGGPPLTARSIAEGLRSHDARIERIFFRLIAVGVSTGETLDEILADFGEIPGERDLS